MPREPTRQLTFTVPGSRPHWHYDAVTLPVGRNQLLIKIEAASFGSVDLAILNTTSLWGSVGEKGLGRDFAGTVVEVGSSLKGKWNEGDNVCGMYFHPYYAGTIASHIVINPNTDYIVTRPDFLPLYEAAAFPLSFTVAYQALKNSKLTQSSTVCVLGGATSVGMFAIQLLKKHFLVKKVVATCSPASESIVRLLGADETIDYTQLRGPHLISALLRALAGPYAAEDDEVMSKDAIAPAAKSGFDFVLDTVGTTPYMLQHQAELTPAKTGWFVSTVGDADAQEGSTFLNSYNAGRSLFGAIVGPRYKVQYAVSSKEALELAVSLYQQERLKIVVDSVTLWGDFKTAVDKVKKRTAKGKVVLKVEPF
ncbi:hypothetical protein BZA70DRAFT_291885 [Myxozyma melibiosi]|uniref:Enoyl reductase (ER) domain-containing protein n=1 Tax=Myxozyma melibiosi TaxID=54550 RepID=A0ABR1EYR0_9ASCO